MRKGKSVVEAILAVVIIFCLIAGVLNLFRLVGSERVRVGVVKRLYEVTHEESSRRMVAITFDDGTTETFMNSDSLLHGKWNSTTLQDNLIVGRRYEFKTFGVGRNELFSQYDNIITATPKEVNR